MKIRPYKNEDRQDLMTFLRNEGEAWSCYYEHEEDYISAVNDSIVYLTVHQETIVGFIRCRKDGAFDIYVYDLLLDEKQRENGLGRRLLLTAAENYPNSDVYILSDADGYYEKQQFTRIGSIFQLGTDGRED